MEEIDDPKNHFEINWPLPWKMEFKKWKEILLCMYSQKLCFDNFFAWKEYNFLSGFLTNTILNFAQECSWHVHQWMARLMLCLYIFWLTPLSNPYANIWHVMCVINYWNICFDLWRCVCFDFGRVLEWNEVVIKKHFENESTFWIWNHILRIKHTLKMKAPFEIVQTSICN